MNATTDKNVGAIASGDKGSNNAGQKFFINIEGHEYEWPKSTITVPEIRTLGNIPNDQTIVVEDPEGTERTLAENEVIELKPGHRIGRAPKYKRG
jgi:hypothetical protein